MIEINMKKILLYLHNSLIKNPLRLCVSARNKIFRLIIIFFILGSSLLAQDSFTIQLDKDAIVLLDETKLTITGENSADYHHKLIVQINNANGKEYSEDVYYENEYHKVTDIEAVIKDLNGKIIRELDEDDIHHSSITLEIDDATTYWFDLYSPKYPYIFERTIEYEYNTLLFWPPWHPEMDIPVLKSTYRIINKASVAFRTHAIGIELKPETTIAGGDSIYTWRMENIPAKEHKYRTPPENVVEKKILFASKYFKVDEFAGSSDSWEDFASWNRRLFQGKYNLSPEAIADVRRITAAATNDHEKIQEIYSYLQENTRYVAIELGIGGWQPYSADWVYNKKYGDCKDLSTCMIAMLDAVDIKAYPALMKTRDSGIVYTDFPSSQFNHVIVFVPLKQDTVWIEATADYLKAGELPFSREGCHVLVIKEDDSEILTTPQSNSSDNLEITRMEGVINSLSKFKFDGVIKYTGNDKFIMDHHFKTKDKQEMEKFIQTYLGRYEATPEVRNYQFSNSNEDIRFSCFR